MKKSYSFGEILLYVREEYKEVIPILEELNRLIQIKNCNSSSYFEGMLSEKENEIRLIVERKYSRILKFIETLKYDWYSMFLYTAHFDVVKSGDMYTLEKDDISTPISSVKRFSPLVEISNQERFNRLVNELFSLDIMKNNRGDLRVNYDFISLDVGNVLISSKLGYESLLYWDGRLDLINYSVKKECCPYLLERILYLEVPVDFIPQEWLRIFEKHEKKFNDRLFFHVDHNLQKNKGVLQINTFDNRSIKLLRKWK